MITVKELIEYLKNYQEDLPAFYNKYSDTRPLKLTEIELIEVAQRHVGDEFYSRYISPLHYYEKKFKVVLFPGN